jgi:hypothetical protein
MRLLFVRTACLFACLAFGAGARAEQAAPASGASIERRSFQDWIETYAISESLNAEPVAASAPESDPEPWRPEDPCEPDLEVPDHFAQASAVANFYDPFSRQFKYGRNRPQPYKFGWYSYDDLTYIPYGSTSLNGRFSSFEWNGSVRFSKPLGNKYVFAVTPTWNTKWWSGPVGESFPIHADQFESDFQLSSARASPWNWQLGLTPQLNADFNRTINSNAAIFDARGVMFYQASPKLQLAVGAAAWDRIHEQIIPYGGLVWNPDDAWEVRLLFPKSRVSRYWGMIGQTNIWTYVSAEYESQAYQVDVVRRVSERMQMTDDQLLFGLNAQRRSVTIFTETGAMLHRRAMFSGPSTNFSIHDAVVARIGLQY